MAIAEIQDSKLAPSHVISSPKLALYVANTISVEENEVSSKPSSKGLMTKQAPSLVSSTPDPKADPKDVPTRYLDELAKYMTLILQELVKLSADQSKINTAQTKLSSSLIKMGEISAKKAADDLQKYIDALDAASHQSWLSKLLGGIAGALCCLLGAITGDPLLMMAGMFTLTMTFSGGSEAFNNAIANLSPALKGIILAGMCIGVAVCLCAAASCMSAMFPEVAEAGTGAAVDAGADAAADASAEEALPQAIDAAPEAAEAPAGAGGQAANKSTSFASKLKADLIKNVPGMTLQQMPQFNFSVELVTGVIELLKKMGAHVSDDDEKEASEITGAIIAFCGAMKGMSMQSGISMGNLSRGIGKGISGFFGAGKVSGEAVADGLKLGLKYSTFALNVPAGAFGIMAGNKMRDAAGITRDMGQAQSLFTIYSALNDLVSTATQNSLTSFKGVTQIFAEINNRWSDFVEPYSYGAEVMG